MHSYKEQIQEYIKKHSPEMVDDIMELCTIDSSKGIATAEAPYGEGPLAALKKAADLMGRFGLTITNYGNYIMTGDLMEDDKNLDIIVHADVVKAGDGWTVTSPFEPVIKDGKIYARGASDNKGPAVASLYAVRAVKELGIPLSKNVRIIIGTDEESDFNDIKAYYQVEKEAKYTIAPDLKFPVTNTEKGQFRGELRSSFAYEPGDRELISLEGGIATNIVPAYAWAVIKGVDMDEILTAIDANKENYTVSFQAARKEPYIKIEAFGIGAHCARVENGDNAVTALMSLVSRLDLKGNETFKQVCTLSSLFPYRDFYGKALGTDLQDEISGKSTISLDIVKIDNTSFYAKFDSRTALSANYDNTIRVIKQAAESRGMTFSYEFDEPHHVSESEPLIQTLLDVYEEATGGERKCTSVGISSYAHYSKKGVAFGAEPLELDTHMHGPDEFVYISDMEKTAVMIAMAIAELCR